MCGRYTIVLERDDLEERFDATVADSFSPRYNAAPGQRLPVITDEAPDRLRRLEWGLVPPWVDEARTSDGLVNARAETIDEKPSFRSAYRRPSDRLGERDELSKAASAGRCLVPADGFYEWVDDVDNRPYRIGFGDDRPFAMAGLWQRRRLETTQAGLDDFAGGAVDVDRDDALLETFTVVTTEPNDLVADLHSRMPVILGPEDERRWLTADDPRALLSPHPGDEMRAYPVSRAVNDPTTDEPSLIDPLES
ncbi:SOS response-associated peptidase [Natrarchaeobius oligotrophus]|uniref:SOS response-associated peptidase n=1 Tax=Natrarchaeobius chitinivorans TaxID=1679083 RepID=A0A3N6PRD4_NATCH|nr:SOS response-associated peptidase [Natrarchaeobius chitinivorans]RQH01996.1 SOS response-associated peptidase [Natrarchaeobius chitinivorans]